MQAETVLRFYWPDLGSTVSIVAAVLALAIFVFAAFSGARANKVRVIFSMILATAIGWCIMPLALKADAVLHLSDTKAGVVILVTLMMLLVAALATSIYEIITVTFSDVGMGMRK